MLTVDGFGLRENQKEMPLQLHENQILIICLILIPTQLWAQAVKMWDYQKAKWEIVKLAILNIGAGRVVYQSLTRVNLAVEINHLIRCQPSTLRSNMR